MGEPVEPRQHYDADSSAAGGQLLRLTGPARLFRVERGAADLFLARQDERGRQSGARHPLLRVEAGDLVFSFPRLGDGLAVVATTTLDSEVREVAWRDLGDQDSLQTLIGSWLRGLFAAFEGEPPPRQATDLETAGGSLTAGQEAIYHGATAWAEVTAGEVELLGLGRLTLASGTAAFPLGRGAWLRATTDSELRFLDPAELARRGGLESALERFHALALERLGEVLEERRRQDAERMAQRQEENRRQVHEALGSLAEVLDPLAVDAAAYEADPLFTACHRIGRELGVEMQRPAEGAHIGDGADPSHYVEEIAWASRIRCRRVRLEKGWWHTDSGPLLAFRDADEAPVVLLRRGRRYRAMDPIAGDQVEVSRAEAEKLLPTAYTFYRPLPSGSLGGLDLLRFSLGGLGRDLFTVALMGLLGGALGLLVPLAFDLLVDSIIPGAQYDRLYLLVGILIAVTIGGAMFNVTRAVALVRMESYMDLAVQASIWDRILNLPIPFFARYTAGDLANRAMGVNTIRRAVSGTTATTIISGVFSILNVGLMFYFSWKLTLIALAVVAAGVLVTITAGMQELRYLRESSELAGTLTGKVLQLLRAVAKLRSEGAENRAFAYWAGDFGRQRRLLYKARLARAIVTTFVAALPVISTIFLFGFFLTLLVNGGEVLTTGRFLAFMAAFGAFQAASLGNASTIVGVLKVIPLYERAKPILQAKTELAVDKSPVGALRGDIEVAHLSFRYDEDGPEVLSDVSLEVGAGQYVAIVGPSGSGKSTLLRLLLGFEQPTSGSVYYDDKNLADADLRSVRRQIGVVLQDGELLSGTVLSSILGALPLSIDDAWEAARMAGLADDIAALPMGMHTLVGESGIGFSGGQRQRLMIARALVGRPRIVFFDEATSALDNPTQAIVSESLDRLQATRVVVAHRLSTIRQADRIYVLDDGKVVESGDFDHLMTAAGRFAELARRQMA